MSMSWLPDTSQGRMVGDYMSASFTGTGAGNVHPVYVVASEPSGGADCSISPAVCNQALFSDSLTAPGGGVSAAADTLAFTPTAGPGASEFKQNR
jgi:hypothetical protein